MHLIRPVTDQFLFVQRDIVSATRVQNIYSFVSVVVGVALGLVVRYVRHLKYFVVAGTLLFVLAFGLLIRYRGGTGTADFAGLVGAEVVLGIAGEYSEVAAVFQSKTNIPSMDHGIHWLV